MDGYTLDDVRMTLTHPRHGKARSRDGQRYGMGRRDEGREFTEDFVCTLKSRQLSRR